MIKQKKIRKLKTVLLFILLFPTLLFGQGNFYDRNMGLESYLDSIDQIVEFDSLIFSNESFSDNAYDGGSELTGYFSNGKLFKIKTWFGLSYGNNSCEYYLKNNELYLVIEKFNGFKYDDKTGSFDYQEYDIGANGYYVFDNKKLIDVTSLGHWRFEDDTNDPELILQEEFDSYYKKLKGFNFKVQLFSEDASSTHDTTISLEYLKNSLDLILLSKFNYEPFENNLINDSTLILKKLDFQIELNSRKFDTSMYNLSYIQNGKILDKINGLKVWGTDGNIPKRVISNIKLKHGKESKLIDKKYFNNLFEPMLFCQKNRCMTNAYLTPDRELIISMFNSDGAGSYTAILIFDSKLNMIEKIVGYGF
jgi:hypothetical protein